MFVVKRNGKKEPVHFDKITARITKLCYGLPDKIQPILVAQKVCSCSGARLRCSRQQTLAPSSPPPPLQRPPDRLRHPPPQVCAGVYPDVTTVELDDLAAETAAYMSTGARGLRTTAQTCLVVYIAGAKSQRGASALQTTQSTRFLLPGSQYLICTSKPRSPS